MSDDKPDVDPRVTTAYLSLPESWQNALWYADVEGLSPRQAAPMLGLPSANAFSALRARARAGLRSAYLLDIVNDDVCNDTVRDQLAALIDGNTTPEAVDRVVDEHLDECDRCSAVATRVATVSGGRAGMVVAAAMVSFHGFTASSSLMPAPVGLAGLASRVQSNASNAAAAAAAVLLLIVGGGLFVRAQASDGPAQLPPIIASAQGANADSGGDDTRTSGESSVDVPLDAPSILPTGTPTESSNPSPPTTAPSAPVAAPTRPPANPIATTSTTVARRVVTTAGAVTTLKPPVLAPVPVTTAPTTVAATTTPTTAAPTTTVANGRSNTSTSTTTTTPTTIPATSSVATTTTTPTTTQPTTPPTTTTPGQPSMDTMRYAVAQAGGVLHVSVAVLNLSGQGGTVTFSSPVILPKSPTMNCTTEFCSLPLGDDMIGETSYVTFTVPSGGTTVTLTTPGATSSFFAFGY